MTTFRPYFGLQLDVSPPKMESFQYPWASYCRIGIMADVDRPCRSCFHRYVCRSSKAAPGTGLPA